MPLWQSSVPYMHDYLFTFVWFFFVSLIYSSCYAMIAPPFRTPSRHARSSHAHDNKGHVDFVVRKRESLSSHLLHADFVGLLNAQHNLGYLCHY